MSQTRLLEIRDSLDAIAPEQWNALCDDGNPFLKHEFLQSLDDAGCLGERTGWYPRYMLLWSEENTERRELLGAVPAYVKTNSHGEFVFDWAWADAYERHQLSYYPKLVSAIPFTPATGQRLLVRADQPWQETADLLARAMRQFADSQDYSSVHYLFVTERESALLSPSSGADADVAETDVNDDLVEDSDGRASVEDDNGVNDAPAADRQNDSHLKRIDCQYHWHNRDYSDFDDFLAGCTSRRRKTIRRERRHVSDAGLRLEQRAGNTLSSQEWAWVHEFYCSTYDRKWGSPSLTCEFFETVARRMGDQVLVVLAYDDSDEQPQKPVACSIMFHGGGTLYGRYWGCRRQYHSLHFEACYYQGIEFCIHQGIRRFEPGAQGEHKITRGFLPTITYSAHAIRHPGFRDAIGDFLEQERPYVEQRCTGLADLLPFKNTHISL